MGCSTFQCILALGSALMREGSGTRIDAGLIARRGGEVEDMMRLNGGQQTLAELVRALDRRRLPLLRIARSSRERQNDVGYTLRMDWPRGEHNFSEFCATPGKARRKARGHFRFWAGSPYRPTSISLVAMSRHDFELHGDRQICRAPDCPTLPAAG